jgi:two-component system phosphate regulon response regulator PhoB
MREAPRILIVEDDAALREVLDLILAGAGYQTTLAPNGADALVAVAQQPPDVILLDWQLPVMDGAHFAQAYRETTGAHAPLIVLSGSQLENRPVLGRWPFAGYVAKSFDLSVLLDVIAQALRQPVA